MNKKQDKIAKRIKGNKKEMLDILKQTPIVQVASKRAGISRASYYRWRKEDEGFAKEADREIKAGRLLINDMAESQLIKQIREENMTAIIFWLKHNHNKYGNRLEITSGDQGRDKPLTDEQKELISKAINLGSIEEKGDKTNE